MNNRFNQIIIKCQQLRAKFHFDYEEKCAKQIEKYSKEIIDKDLVNKCEDRTFAKQLCIMNCLKYEKENNPLPIYESDTLNDFFDRPKKPFYVHNVRKVLNQLNKEEISFSKTVEILNEIASDFYKKR